jgi:signal transduction histidine kinase
MTLATLLEQKVFPKVLKPGRYVGGEMGAQIKTWDPNAIKVAIGYPDLYEVGMSSRGIQIVYQVLNRLADVLCERFFAPAGDLEQILIDEKKLRQILYNLVSNAVKYTTRGGIEIIFYSTNEVKEETEESKSSLIYSSNNELNSSKDNLINETLLITTFFDF